MMTNVLSKLGVQWSIQDDELHITDTDLTTDEAPVFLTSETGLIGIPTKRRNGGYLFSSLLNPKIRPGRPLIIESELVSGTFRPLKVNHLGDLDDGPWDTQVEAFQIA